MRGSWKNSGEFLKKELTEEQKALLLSLDLSAKVSTLSVQTKRKISESHKGLKKPWAAETGRAAGFKNRGSKHWNWKGGKSRAYKTGYWSVEYKNWRREVFIRDSFKCTRCGYSSYVEAHHLKPFSLNLDLRYDVSNGTTLCRKCHKDTHKDWVQDEKGYHLRSNPTMRADRNGDVYGGALPKRVKVGGIFYKGFQLVVASNVGDYPIAMVMTTAGHAYNSLSITPDSYGAGDNYAAYVMDTTATTGGKVLETLLDNVYNLGGGVTVNFDFASLQKVDPGNSIKFVYTNTATKAMNVYITAECIK